MKKTLFKPKTSGEIKAIASKSEVHRLLICAALADNPTQIICQNTNSDIEATVNCLCSLSAEITYKDGIFSVNPIKEVPQNTVLSCKESGSTLRFLLPLVSFFGNTSIFDTEGRLFERPLSPLKEELIEGGTAILSKNGQITVSGKCQKTDFTIAGNVSSQFISGLMFMLTKTGGSITVTGKTQSLPYIEMTADALSLFGAKISFSDNKITVKKCCPLKSPQKTESFGDWSNAAFFITAGVIGAEEITLTGLDINSRQGDRKIIDILRQMGARIEIKENRVTSFPSKLKSVNIDAKDIPDLVPVLSVAASNADGVTKIYNCERLRLKESDRIEAVKDMIQSLGGKIEVINDCIYITGSPLSGGTVDSKNDHRIAMSAATASFATKNSVTVINAEAVNKSYPSFWDEIKE